ncbi:MAG TPA: cytochrome b5-like heme/steroid binding domain-containing protein [Patescibacteria group bacterium]|nr:cytochrome b5-like heme/steroid binding domain-containing protein [Patescibacteria group bacterium]
MNEEAEDSVEGPIEEPTKKQKNLLPILLVMATIIVIGSVFMYFSNNQVLEENKTLSTVSEKTINMTDVNLHNSKEDCWLVIEGGVYDVTSIISKHPGGEIIVSACGTDATNKFNNRPVSGTSHSSLARKMLQSLRLGSLSE